MSEYKKAFDAAKKKAKEDDDATKKNIENMSDEEQAEASKEAAKSKEASGEGYARRDAQDRSTTKEKVGRPYVV
jgi:hypothetical protein